MNFSSNRAVSLTVATIAAALAVNVSFAEPSHLDVRAACPGVDAVLQETLLWAWSRYQLEGTVRVDLELQGQRIIGVKTPKGPMAYRAAVRRAVSDLSCNAGGDQRRTIGFEVRFTDEFVASAPS